MYINQSCDWGLNHYRNTGTFSLEITTSSNILVEIITNIISSLKNINAAAYGSKHNGKVKKRSSYKIKGDFQLNHIKSWKNRFESRIRFTKCNSNHGFHARIKKKRFESNGLTFTNINHFLVIPWIMYDFQSNTVYY